MHLVFIRREEKRQRMSYKQTCQTILYLKLTVFGGEKAVPSATKYQTESRLKTNGSFKDRYALVLFYV